MFRSLLDAVTQTVLLMSYAIVLILFCTVLVPNIAHWLAY